VIVFPDWDRPANVHIAVTDRLGGVSDAPFGAFNLATHVGDSEVSVLDNRRKLIQCLGLENPPFWLDQVHGAEVSRIAHKSQRGRKVDGVYTQSTALPLAIMTADCMPILVCDREGTQIAAAHAGWRGLAAGIIENIVSQFTTRDLLVFLAPTIDVCHYEVSDAVRKQFNCVASFSPSNMRGRWMFDLYHEASQQFESHGVSKITMQRRCTYCDELLYSYRRDVQTGRFASLIWMD